MLISKDRPMSIKGFCYDNQEKRVRKQIFIQKWQWRMNEKRNYL